MKDNKIPEDKNIIDLPLEAAMPDNYLPYAVDVAKDRALPDVRDGLKPVHRRILYGAYLLKAFPDRPYFKSARIVGDIMGKFHPHGDSSIYDAMSILAQDFSTRVPLIEGQGNWGSQDGDPAAAMRYTEARLSKAAMLLLKDIEMDTVDFTDNYSDTEKEPVIIPARFPNLLVNGSFGIAVGLSTNIPPHNPGESLDAVIALIDNPGITTKSLIKYIKGPDLPTGGIIIGSDSLLSAYETGEGKCTLRAKTEIEKLDNGRLGIVISEFPYRKNKARILQTISEMTGDRKHSKQLEAIGEIRDESGRIGIRAVIEFKRNTSMEEADRIRKYLLKKTDLQSNLNFNMVAIDNGKPVTLSLKMMLEAYLAHQRETVKRRTEKELDNAMKRFHIVEGFIKAINIMDELIKTIRASENKANALENIMEKFGFTKEQGTAILELMLYRLTGLELHVFTEEHKKLTETIKELNLILNNPRALDNLIKKELREVKKQLSDERRTVIIKDDDEAHINVEELIVVEDSMATVTREGFIKKVDLKTYNRTSDPGDIEVREGDEVISVFKTNTVDNILLFTDLGNMYQIKSRSVPEMKWKDKGVRVDELLRNALKGEEKVVSAFSMEKVPESAVIRFITDRGGIKRTEASNFDSKYSKIVAIKLLKGEKVISAVMEDMGKITDNSLASRIKPADENIIESGNNNSSETPGEETEASQLSLTDITGKEASGEGFINITTEKNLNFTVPMALCEVTAKMVKPESVAVIPYGDKIKSVKYQNDYSAKSFSIKWSGDSLTISDTGKTKRSKKEEVRGIFETDSYDEILFILATGQALKYPSYIFENASGGIKLSDILPVKSGDEVAGISVLKSGEGESNGILTVTSSGSVKIMDISEFTGLSGLFPVIKFRNQDDKIIFSAKVSDETKNITVITARGMGIRFLVSQVSGAGRMALGVQGISLREEDRAVFASLSEGAEYTILTDHESRYTVKGEKFRIQNRAGKGIRLVTLILDESVEKVILK